MDDEPEKSIHGRMFLSHQFIPNQTHSNEKLPSSLKMDTNGPSVSRFEKSIISSLLTNV